MKKGTKKKIVKKKAKNGRRVTKKKVSPKRTPKKTRKTRVEKMSSVKKSEFEPILNRMLDVVVANTLQVKASLVLMSQMNEMLLRVFNPVYRVSSEEKQPKTVTPLDISAKVPTVEGSQLKNLPSEEKSPITLNKLSSAFQIMKKNIGEDKAHEYLAQFNNCQKISALEEGYFLAFKDGAKPWVNKVLSEKVDKKEELEATGVTPPDTVKLTIEDVRKAIGEVDKAKGRDIAKSMLTFFDVDIVGALPKEKYPEIIAKCKKTIEE